MMQANIKMNVIHVWAQHPLKRFLTQPFLDSLKRWTGLSDVRQQLALLGPDDDTSEFFLSKNACLVFGL